MTLFEVGWKRSIFESGRRITFGIEPGMGFATAPEKPLALFTMMTWPVYIPQPSLNEAMIALGAKLGVLARISDHVSGRTEATLEQVFHPSSYLRKKIEAGVHLHLISDLSVYGRFAATKDHQRYDVGLSRYF